MASRTGQRGFAKKNRQGQRTGDSNKEPIKLRKADLGDGSNQEGHLAQYNTDQIYTAQYERLFQLESGYYLLYYHRPERWRMLKLYLKFLIPIVGLFYLIKKNPFYMSYPAMLPFMVICFVGTIISMIKYSRVTNMMVHQVQMDPTGSELMFIYQNQFFRRMRNDKPEQPVLIQQLVDPPQGGHYKPLPGDKFPTTYPVDFEDIFSTGGPSYFYRKYYITQRLFFSFAKKPMYCNFEVLVNALNQKVVDMSKADVVLVKTSESSRDDFERFISKMDVNSQY